MELQDLFSFPCTRHCPQKMFSMSFKKYCKEKKGNSRLYSGNGIALTASVITSNAYCQITFALCF